MRLCCNTSLIPRSFTGISVCGEKTAFTYLQRQIIACYIIPLLNRTGMTLMPWLTTMPSGSCLNRERGMKNVTWTSFLSPSNFTGGSSAV